MREKAFKNLARSLIRKTTSKDGPKPTMLEVKLKTLFRKLRTMLRLLQTA